MDQLPLQPEIVQPKLQNKNKGNSVLPVVFLIVLFIVLVVWMNLPIAKYYLHLNPPTLTPSATATYVPTRTPRPTFTPTITPTITATPIPASAHVISEPASLIPPIPGLPQGSIVLKAQDAQVDPPYTHPQWVPSSKSLPGKDLTDSYYATFGPGSVLWTLDTRLTPGLYQIFVCDTLYSSAGVLDYEVREGDSSLTPLTDSTHVRFASSREDIDGQNNDQWHSIGIYNMPGADILNIRTSWGQRDEYTLVAVDRIVIMPLPASDQEMINRLPVDRQKIIVDDSSAAIDGNPVIIGRDDSLAWNGTFQSVTNPEKDVKVTWTMPYQVPAGSYEILFWLPAAHANGSFDATIFVNGKDISSGKLPTIKQSDFPGGNWVSMGVWDTSNQLYGSQVIYSIQWVTKGGTVGDIAYDSIAFVGPPPGQETATPTP